MLDLLKLGEMLERHEGLRLKPYRDSVGKLTIGVGRNLDDVGISAKEASLLLDSDIRRAIEELDQAVPWWRTLSGVRQLVLANMCFNLGISRLLIFKKFFVALEVQAWESAAREMLSSRWANQVGARATELAEMMRTDAL